MTPGLFSEQLANWVGHETADVSSWLHEHVRSAWESGNEGEAIAVLLYLHLAGPEGFVDILEESVQHMSSEIKRRSYAIVEKYASIDVLTPTIRAVLVEELDRGDPRLQRFALWALSNTEDSDFQDKVRRLAQRTTDERVAVHANLVLLERGDSTGLHVILKFLREHPAYYGIASQVWLKRDKLIISRDDFAFLRSLIVEYCSKLEEEVERGNNSGVRESITLLRGTLES